MLNGGGLVRQEMEKVVSKSCLTISIFDTNWELFIGFNFNFRNDFGGGGACEQDGAHKKGKKRKAG